MEPPGAQQDVASILVVDDTLPNLELLSKMLKERGYRVRPVPSGDLALQAAQSNPPDLILLDIHMPQMNGYEVCKRLKADEKLQDIPVLFISGLSNITDKVEAFRVGGADYITKPFQFEEVEARVATHLELRRQRRQLRESAEAREHEVVVEERTRIAREIHDTLAQGFTGIVIQLEAAEDVLVEQPEAARLHVLQARTLARECLAEARRSVWALRPQALEAHDLGYAFVHLVHKLAEGSGTPIGFTLRGVLRPLGQDLEHHLLRIGQEALTNALRHAKATEIRVTLTCGSDCIELSVEDRGEGFEVDSPVHGPGLGLRGMQERADSLGGKLTITSAPGQGTRVRVVLPVPLGEGGSLAEDKPDQDSHR